MLLRNARTYHSKQDCFSQPIFLSQNGVQRSIRLHNKQIRQKSQHEIVRLNPTTVVLAMDDYKKYLSPKTNKLEFIPDVFLEASKTNEKCFIRSELPLRLPSAGQTLCTPKW